MDATEAKAVKPLHPQGYKMAETARMVYHITPPAGSVAEDLLAIDFWVHVARSMRVGDKIEVMPADKAWYGELLVLDVGKDGYKGARVAYVHGPVKLERAPAIGHSDAFGVRWGGPHGKWQVLRKEDNEVIKQDLPSKESAEKWVASHMKAMAA